MNMLDGTQNASRPFMSPAGFWFDPNTAGGLPLTGTYNQRLVVASVLVAIVSAFFALRLSGQAGRLSNHRTYRHLTLIAGALSLGVGVWAMHFIGMLAFDLCLPITYNVGITLGSMVPSVAASAIAFLLINKQQLKGREIWLGGALVGAGIGLMHYSGMAAMEMTITLQYDFKLFVLSVVVAVVMATFSIWLQQHLKLHYLNRLSAIQIDAVSAIVMGSAIASMHYVGMAAARFVADKGFVATNPEGTPVVLYGLSIATIAMLITVLVSGISAYIGQKEAAKALLNSETQLKQLVLNLQERKHELERYASIISGSSDGIISKTLDGIITSWNPGAERIFGYSMQEAVGRSILMLFPPDKVDEEQTFLDTIRSQQSINNHETVRCHKSGRLIDVAVNLSPIFDSEHRVIGISKIVRDITEKKQADQLKQAKENAERRAEAHAAFLAHTSHELRTPMNAILGYVQLLAQSRLDPEQRDHLDTLQHAAGAMLQMINDILDASKLEQGSVTLLHERFQLAKTWPALQAQFSQSAAVKGLHLRFEVEPHVPAVVLGDELRLQQILSKLVSNAIKFTEKGRVEVHASLHAGKLHVRVRDTGVGMSPEQLETVQAAFQQADSGNTRRFGGLGLGITIAQQLVALMRGEFSIESTLGQGTTVCVALPLTPAVADTEPPVRPTQPTEPQPPAPALPPLNILIVDDVPLNLKILGKLLMSAGHRVSAVTSGKAAISAFLKSPFDVILMDIQMPEMTGLEATKAIRQLESDHQRPRTPVIAVTASTLIETQDAAELAGMDGFVGKPVMLSTLTQEIAQVLAHSHLP